MSPRRLAYIVNVFPKLSETFIAHELAELRRRGVEVRVFSLRQPQDKLQHEIVSRAGLDKIVTYEVDRFPQLLAEFEPELLHAHFATEPTAAARAYAGTLGIPFTFTAHGYDIRRKPPADFTERAAAASRVITVSRANAEYISTHFQVPHEHIRVIPCGVNVDTFRPLPQDAERALVPLVVCVARHVKVKNLAMLLECCGVLRARGTEFRCIMVGDGPLRLELEAIRRQLGLEGYVAMTGAASQSQVLEFWQKAAVAVLTSDNEGMPVCLMEAAACGVPAVATAVGGIPELVVNGVTGLLSPAGDVPAFAAALERMLLDNSFRSRAGEAARERIQKHFTLKSQVDHLLEVWSEILEQRQSCSHV